MTKFLVLKNEQQRPKFPEVNFSEFSEVRFLDVLTAEKYRKIFFGPPEFIFRAKNDQKWLCVQSLAKIKFNFRQKIVQVRMVLNFCTKSFDAKAIYFKIFIAKKCLLFLILVIFALQNF